jgi:hypothetical protein
MSDISRLPKWAQKEFANLQRELWEAREKRDEYKAALEGDGGSEFIIDLGLRKDEVPLPSSAKYLTWRCGDFELRLRNDDGHLEVMCTSWHGVAIRPSATNVVRIGPGRTK